MPTGAKGLPGPFTQEVAAILRARAARLRINQTALADTTKISASQVNRMLAGAKHIDVDQLEKFTLALGLNMRAVIDEAQDAVDRGRSEYGSNVVPFPAVGGSNQTDLTNVDLEEEVAAYDDNDPIDPSRGDA